MQKALSLDEIGKDIARFSEQKESLERQIRALGAAQTALHIEDPNLPRNSSQYTLGPHRRVMANAIYEVLKEDRPLNRQAILNRVIDKGVLSKELNPLKRVSEILTADARFEKVQDRRGFWTLSEICRNDLQSTVQSERKLHTQNETAEGCDPTAASTTREVLSPMVTVNGTTKRQVKTGKNPKTKTPAVVTALDPGDPDDSELGRQQRGIAIAAIAPIKKTKVGYSVRSQSGNGNYTVRLDGEDGPACSCPDFETREEPCKHIYAVELYLMLEENPTESPDWTANAETSEPVKKPAAKRDWAAYKLARENEQKMFGKLLSDLCDAIPQPPQGKGRPRMPLSDMVQAIAIKVYSTKATETAMGDVENATRDGQLGKRPSATSIIRYLEKPELTPLLEALIERSALPLRGVEVDFAADSSGFGTSVYARYVDHKWGRPIRQAQFVKAHITCGVQTNIVTTAKVTAGQSSDARQLPAMVKATARNFNISEFSADKAYLSRENLRVITQAGGTPYIPFKENSVAHSGHHRKDDLWEKSFLHFQLRRQDFLAHYHKRSNVETCFSMMKAKFGASVRCKTPTAQVNEVLAKILCHNIVVLVQAMYELGIDPGWQKEREAAMEWESLPMAA